VAEQFYHAVAEFRRRLSPQSLVGRGFAVLRRNASTARENRRAAAKNPTNCKRERLSGAW
jgi:hypothetical protein